MNAPTPNTALTGDAVLTRSVDVVFRRVAGESLLVPIRGGAAELESLFMLNEVGACVWEAMDGRMTVDDLCQRVTSAFDVDAVMAQRDVSEFLAGLLAAGLVESTPEIAR